jgi:membrane protein DedA with SNARE-associated domain
VPVPQYFRDASRALLALIVAHQYVVLFIVVAIEEAGIPLPAPTDVVIAYYGYRAAGDLPALAQVVLICALASTAGTLVPYALAYRFGDLVAHRIAPLLDVDPRTIDKWEERIHRHGFVAVLIARLIPGARVVSSVIAGTAKVPVHAFSPAVFVAAAIYWTLWVTIGALFGPTAEDIIGPTYVRYVFVAIPIVFILFFAWRILRARRRRVVITSGGMPDGPVSPQRTSREM